MHRHNPIYNYGLFFLGGFINALAVMLFGRNIGIHTGNLSSFFITFVSGDYNQAFSLFMTVLCFMIGSTIIGLVSENQVFQIGRLTKLAWIHGISAVLFLILILFNFSDAVTLNALALYMGVQNGLPYPHYNNRMRTTSMTGLLTGLGLKIGALLQNRSKKNFFAVMISLKNLSAFIVGVILLAILQVYTNIDLLTLAMFFQVTLSVYLVYVKKERTKKIHV